MKKHRLRGAGVFSFTDANSAVGVLLRCCDICYYINVSDTTSSKTNFYRFIIFLRNEFFNNLNFSFIVSQYIKVLLLTSNRD